eukprot:10102590-Karenia_brevis.AAC.1
MQDISRQTVVRCEIETAACWLGSCVNFHSEMECRLDTMPVKLDSTDASVLKYPIAAHILRSDATNGTAFKFHNTELLSVYVFGTPNIFEDGTGLEASSFQFRTFADLQRVNDATGDC